MKKLYLQGAYKLVDLENFQCQFTSEVSVPTPIIRIVNKSDVQTGIKK